MSALANELGSQDQTNADVLFYVLNSDLPEAREQFLSKLLQKIWQQKRQADVRFASENDAQRYDLTLWSYKPESFIPHSIQHDNSAPIQLFGESIPKPCKDVCVNLHPEFFEAYTQYQRTIEVLDQSEHLIQMGRERWKAYLSRGITPTVHKIVCV